MSESEVSHGSTAGDGRSGKDAAAGNAALAYLTDHNRWGKEAQEAGSL